MRCRIACYVTVVLGLFAATLANAQLIDDVDVRAVSATRAEARIKLAAQVRLVRSAVSANGRTLQVFFQITQADEAVTRVVEEARKSPPNAPVEPFTVIYTPINQTGVRRVDIVFSQPVKPSVRLGPDGRSFVVTLPLLVSPAEKATAAATPQPQAPAPAAIVQPAEALPTVPVAGAETRSIMDRAKAALARKDYETALAQFNILLNQPPNDTSQEAQELVGLAREGLGETRKAKAEYELYLKLYPTGDGATRVRERLKAIEQSGAAGAPTADKAGGTTAARASSTTVWGSVSQSYYGGQSRIDTSTIIVTPATNATIIDQQSITGTDQSSVVTSVDANARIRSGDWETRLALRDTYTWSLLKDVASRNRLTAAYADVRNQTDRYGFRIGRQSPGGAGVLYRFDGLSASYNFSPMWKVGMVAGTPADVTPGERKTFYGASLDAEGLLPGFGSTLYFIEQRAGNYADRRAAGTELRYNTERINVIGTFDYDVLFRRVNIGSFQGTYNLPDTLTINALYDYRASPPLQLSNGLMGLGVANLADVLAQVNMSAAQRYASALTPVSRVALLGFTVPFGKGWQAGLDYRVSSVSATEATPAFPASPATGDIKTVSAQLIGSGVWGASDVFVVNASYLTAPAYKGWLVALNPRFVFATKWTVEPILRWYRQTDNSGLLLTRWSPTLRASWRWSDKISLDAEASWEIGKSRSLTVHESTNHLFYYIGYRYDF